ncbi:Mini-chromosome maintenance complex-binding protein [Kalmanozyma brasiliensis GHG001]|uniref:Pyridoxal phosphate homeostasis protein n=1 Tax=Kalmanozyma brasiliensis (strain GHG001) TaxID=1365824 RepID=V5GHY7_KALBG|nr:Mini-chromosome maintenance complex-binding protein [Kalmanozyma brasiliensis GHG001]EST05567.1 Mini-chromosome maintenance complex-binding protein [Kalmanozyma brasiliensis GHG001]
MVPDTDFSLALTKPLDVVQQIYNDAQDKTQTNITKSVETHFRQLFSSPDASAKIPSLSPDNISTLLPKPDSNPSSTHRLVRFRAMIQDTGLGTEVFLAKHQHDGRTFTGLYGGEASIASSQDTADHSEHDELDHQNLAERTVMYAVSVPGQPAWAAEAHREAAAAQSSHSDVDQLASATSAVTLDEPQSPQKVQEVRERIRKAAQKGKEIGSAGKEPRLVAISKLHPPSAILAAHKKADQLHFGENYVQEMVDKAKVLPREIRWHFVGGLQSNKGKLLASIPNLYLLETLDSVKAANVLQKALSSPDAAKRDEPLRVYLQVNTSGEDAKSGLPPISSEDAEQAKDSELLQLAIHVITKCPELRLRGVMTIGAADNSSSASAESAKSVDEIISANPDFERLIQTRTNLVQLLRNSNDVQKADEPHIKEAYADLLEGTDATGGLELSMGMSADMDVATMAGSDNVRVGTDCFGRRPGTREEATNGMKRELEVGPEAAAEELRSQQTPSTSSNSASSSEPNKTSLPRAYLAKSPLPEVPHVGGLIKLYDLDAAEKFKTTELIEVVGILDTAGLPQAEWQETGSAAGSSSEPAQVPCVHALYASSVDLDSLAVEASSSSVLSQSSEREALVDYLAGALGGDKVAAELVLLATIARIHVRRANLCLGALTLNVSNFGAPASAKTAQTELSRRLTQLLPAVVDVSMDLSTLNDDKKPLYPRSAGEGTGLEAGRLQLVNGTTVVVNEGTMGEGQLKDTGIRNIKALSSVLESHKLPYAFPYSEFEFDADLNAIILSQGKSFLPFDIQCPLQPGNADLYADSAAQVDESKLREWRKALAHARSVATAKAFEIPESVSEHIQQEFVAERKKEQEEAKDSHGGASSQEGALGQEDLLRRMAIVRLLALSHGEKSLSTDMWKKAVELDKTLAQRVAATQQGQQRQQPSASTNVSR